MKSIITALFGKKKKTSARPFHFPQGTFSNRNDIRGVFSKIYRDKMWGNGSGGGSLPDVVKPYVTYLNNLLKEKSIKSVVDLGCGDWQFSRFVEWDGIHYTGVDVVEELIVENRKQFAKNNISFRCVNVFKDGFESLPPADLLISKDVLQHLSNENISLIFKSTLSGRYKYLLITNDYYSGDAMDIPNGDTRPLDIRRAPFNIVNAIPVLSFNSKKTFLVENE